MHGAENIIHLKEQTHSLEHLSSNVNLVIPNFLYRYLSALGPSLHHGANNPFNVGTKYIPPESCTLSANSSISAGVLMIPRLSLNPLTTTSNCN
jgi:hypothetical protein